MQIFSFTNTFKKINLLAISALAFSSTLSAQSTLVDHYKSGNFDCAIFPETYLGEVEGKPFTPQRKDADEAIKLVEETLKDVKCSKKDYRDEIVKYLSKYKVQVFGYTDQSGNKILLLNYFRNDGDKDKELASIWLSEMILVDGAGTDFWNIKYDIVKKKLFEFKCDGS